MIKRFHLLGTEPAHVHRRHLLDRLRRLPVQAVQDDLCGPDSVGPPLSGPQRSAKRVHSVRFVACQEVLPPQRRSPGPGLLRLMRGSPTTNPLPVTPPRCFSRCFSTFNSPRKLRHVGAGTPTTLGSQSTSYPRRSSTSQSKERSLTAYAPLPPRFRRAEIPVPGLGTGRKSNTARKSVVPRDGTVDAWVTNRES